jgi:peptidoglycan/xylan/chitin deacetylase (PgdA/CDA1 family)
MCRVILIFCAFGLMGCATTSPDDSGPDEPAPGVVFRFETDRKIIALTIDDGPDGKTTGRILDVLDKHESQATFFIIGDRIEGNELLLERMRDEGHELANHTKANRPTIFLSSSSLEADLERTHEMLAPYGEIRWFRPGFGAYHRSMVETAAARGYRTALGDVFPYDVFVPSSGFHQRYVLSHIKPGSIIIVHDGGGWGKRTAETLDAVLPQLREQGFVIVTLSRLAEAVNE